MEEIWKDVIGFESYYEVSSFGRVRRKRSYNRLHTDGILRHRLRRGYLAVELCVNSKQYSCSVHRLVAEAFISNPLNLPCINHKDENKLNNKVDNLEWCTYKYNTNYGDCIRRRALSRKLNGKTCIPVQVLDINGNYIAEFRNIAECASFYKTSTTQIRRCINRNKLLKGIYKIIKL